MKSQSKLILIVLAGTVTAMALYFAVIKPTMAKISFLKVDIVAKKTELRQLEEQIITYKNSQRDLSKAAGKEIISGSLLQREDLELAIVEVEKGATLSGISEIMNIQDETATGTAQKKATPQIIPGKAFLEEVNYSLTTSSNFTQFVDFLSYLEHLPHFTEVISFAMRSSDGAAGSTGIFVHKGEVNSIINSVFFVQKK